MQHLLSYRLIIVVVILNLLSLLGLSVVPSVHSQTSTPLPPTMTLLLPTATLSSSITITVTAIPNPTPSLTGIARWLPSNPDEVRKAILTAVLSALGALFVVYFQKIIAGLRGVIEWVWNRIKVEQAVEARCRKRLAKELRAIQILDMPEAKDLEAFYIPLKLAKWVSADLKEAGHGSDTDVLNLSEALELYGRITIVGAPGSGKTTITSHAAAALADHNLRINNKKIFPIYIRLRRLKEFLENEKDKSKSLKDLAAETLGHFGFSDAHKFFERKLVDGVCLIVLDGFDELADKEGILQQRLANKVNDFVTSISPDNRIVLTSRAAGYEPAWFPGFRVLEMTELTLPQARQFVSGWFGKGREEYVKSLQNVLDTNERLQLLVTNPLMLAIVCYVYSTKKPNDNYLPQRRVDLYERCIETLIVEWDRSRGIDRKPNFTFQQVKIVLQYVAYEALRDEKIDFSKKQLLALIHTHMPKAELPQYASENFLKEVLEHTGLFKEKAHDIFGFIHLTFQEYLAAQVIANKVLDGVEIKDIRAKIGDVIANLANPGWTEPITLAAGILRGRTELVTVLYDEYKERPTSEFRMLMAGSLRDADLDDFSFDPDYLIKQDEILSELIEAALT